MKLKFSDKNKTYCEMMIIVSGQLADYYLDEFNQVKKTGIFPSHYLNKKDALRELQYLCEYWKIRQFELKAEPAQSW